MWSIFLQVVFVVNEQVNDTEAFEKSILSRATGVGKRWSCLLKPCLHGSTLMVLWLCGWTGAASGTISEWVLNGYSLGRGQLAWELVGAFPNAAGEVLCWCSSAHGFLAINLMIKKKCWWEGKKHFEGGKSATPDWLNVNGRRWWAAPKGSRQKGSWGETCLINGWL